MLDKILNGTKVAGAVLVLTASAVALTLSARFIMSALAYRANNHVDIVSGGSTCWENCTPTYGFDNETGEFGRLDLGPDNRGMITLPGED